MEVVVGEMISKGTKEGTRELRVSPQVFYRQLGTCYIILIEALPQLT